MGESPKFRSHISVTESPGWNGLKTLGACVSGRLGRHSRPGKPSHRPKKHGNNAALIEMDLDPVLRANYPAADLTQESFDKMNDAAIKLLRSLNIMANLQLIPNERPSTNPDGTSKTTLPEDSYLAELRASVDKIAMIDADFERLHKLMSYLISPSTLANHQEFSLTTGPHPLFALPAGDTGDLAISCLRLWNEVTETLPGRLQTVEEGSLISLDGPAESTGQEAWNARRGDRVGSIVEAILNEFRQLSCVKKTTHEIRLHVSNDLYPGPTVHQHNLDMFISCCPGSTLVFQSAQCGDFKVTNALKKCICDSISQAMRSRTRLHILVNAEGVYDVTDRLSVVRLPCDGFDGMSLHELLEKDVFGPIDTQAYLSKTAASKVNSATKAQVALGLSRCLMDFFDKGLELASHSWIAENVHFRESSINTREGKQRLLYVSLRPNLDQSPSSDVAKMFKSGNPVVLSFAKLLLEVLDGKVIRNIRIMPDDSKNFSTWSDLDSVVQNLRRDRGAEPFASKYLEVVGDCLNLWATLKNFENRTELLATSRHVRKAIYEKMVHKLELLAISEQTKHSGLDASTGHERKKRKCQDPLPGESPAKKSSPFPWYSHAPRLAKGQSADALVSDSDQGTAVEEPEFTEHTEEDGEGVSLYDEQGEADQFDRTTAKEYLARLNQGFERYIKPLKYWVPNEMDPIKVAIIDSGLDLDDPWIRARRCQIGDTRNWTSDQHDECVDDCGHGTHVARLILGVAPAVKVYIAKVSERKKLDSKASSQIAQAIEWATGVWKVDIISLSLGMDGQDETIRKALDKVLYPPRDNPEVVVIAAASNWGGNDDIAFPACYRDIICIHSTDGYGNPSKTNPTPQEGKDLAVLGMSIKSSAKGKDKKRAEAYISGTSYATAIGAGIAANVMEFARRDPKLRDKEKRWLFSSWGMSCVLSSMSKERGGYRYVRPWKLFDGRAEEDVCCDIRDALKPRVRG